MDESLKAGRGKLNHKEIAVENVVLSDVQTRPFLTCQTLVRWSLPESIVEMVILGAWARRLSKCVRVISVRHV